MAKQEMPAVPKYSHDCPADSNDCENVVCLTVLVLHLLYRCPHNPTSLLKSGSAVFIRAPFQVRRLESALRNQ